MSIFFGAAALVGHDVTAVERLRVAAAFPRRQQTAARPRRVGARQAVSPGVDEGVAAVRRLGTGTGTGLGGGDAVLLGAAAHLAVRRVTAVRGRRTAGSRPRYTRKE